MTKHQDSVQLTRPPCSADQDSMVIWTYCTSVRNKRSEFCPANQTPMSSWPTSILGWPDFYGWQNIKTCPANHTSMSADHDLTIWSAEQTSVCNKHRNFVQLTRPLSSADQASKLDWPDFCDWQNIRICPANQTIQLTRTLWSADQTSVAEKT
jgi:hypothetical protein